jgi:hypothetical protein
MIIKKLKEKKEDILIIILVILFCLLSRIITLNNIIWDKHLGDLLYAVMFYFIFKLFIKSHKTRVIMTFSLMVLFEFVQLTGFPSYLKSTDSIILHIFAFLIGSKFSFIDIGIYSLGLILIHMFKRVLSHQQFIGKMDENYQAVRIKDYSSFFSNLNLLQDSESPYYLLFEDSSKNFQETFRKYQVKSIPNLRFGTFFPKSSKFMIKLDSEVQRLLVSFSRQSAGPEICSHLFYLKEKEVIADWYDFPFDPLVIYYDKVGKKKIDQFVRSVM